MRSPLRNLILAVQFLTRLPTPQLREFHADELARSTPWFPLVGALIGLAIWAGVRIGQGIDPWLGALLGLLIWIIITGALHLDGLADLTDGLGAAHRDPQRLLSVMRDPHLGSFGVLALLAQCLSKLVLLKIVAPFLSWWTLPLLCAWARYGVLCWSAWLPALPGSSTERFSWNIRYPSLVINAVLLLACSAYGQVELLCAPVVLFGWGLFLQRRLRGVSGDCLGAGVEISESVLLALLLLPRAFST